MYCTVTIKLIFVNELAYLLGTTGLIFDVAIVCSRKFAEFLRTSTPAVDLSKYQREHCHDIYYILTFNQLFWKV